MQRIVEKTLERNIPADELHMHIYYERCRVFALSGYKEAVIKKGSGSIATKKEIKRQLKKNKVLVDTIIEDEIIEPEDKGHVAYEIFKDSNIKFIPASIACVGKEDLCLCLFMTDVYYRKENYGTQLMSTLKDVYKNQKLHLYVRVSNKVAINFYKKNGWIEDEVYPNFYWDTLHDEDALKMILQC